MEAGQHSQVLYSMFPFGETTSAARPGRNEPTKPLIRLRFGGLFQRLFRSATKHAGVL
jgi:hypothetical protein